MIASLAWLGLAVADPEDANAFYEPLLGPPNASDTGEVRYVVGGSELRLKPPGSTPRGGAHVHYAFSTGDRGYARAKETLADAGPLEEHDLDVYRSVYAFDPDDHCVEVANRDDDTNELTGLFEIVLEVDALDRAEAWYDRFDPVLMDRGASRRRTRLDMGPFELELWEPQRGIADAAPGKHVDIGLIVEDLEAVVADTETTSTSSGVRVTDPDGHQLTFRER